VSPEVLNEVPAEKWYDISGVGLVQHAQRLLHSDTFCGSWWW
jgi:hypothetical protein